MDEGWVGVLFEAEGLVGLAMFMLWVYCIIDVISTDAALMRNLPKMGWLFLVIVLSVVGSVAWLALGRPQRAGFWPGDTTYRPRRSATWGLRGPEDDPGYSGSTTATPSRPRSVEDDRQRSLEAREAELRKLELDRWEDDLARRERELRDRDRTSDDGPAGSGLPPSG